MAPFSRPFGAEPFGGSRSSNITDLILRRGDIAAQRALDSGAMWGGAIANIGQAVGGMLAQRQEQKQESKREQAWNSYIEAGTWMENPQELFQKATQIYGLERGTKLAAGFHEWAKAAGGMVKPEEARLNLGIQLDAFLAMPETEQQKRWPDLVKANEKSPLVKGLGPISPEWNAETKQNLEPALIQFRDNLLGRKPQERPQTAPPGVGIWNEKTGKYEIAVPKPEDRPKAGSFEAYVASIGANTPEAILAAKARWEAAGRAPTKGPEGPKLGSLEAFLVNKYGPTPTAEQQIEGLAAYEAAKKGTAAGEGKNQSTVQILRRMKDLSGKLITGEGPGQIFRGLARQAKSKVGWDADFKVYSDLRASLASQVAVAQQGGRPSDADVFRSALPLIPDPAGGDTKSSAAQKWAQVEDILLSGLSPEGKAQIGLTSQPSARPQGGYLSTDPNAAVLEP